MNDLADLNDEDFQLALKHALWKENRWQAFLADDVVDRAYEASRDLLATINVQLTSSDAMFELEWVTRAKNLRKRLMWRIGQLKIRIKELNAAETATVEAKEKKWSVLAQSLAEAIEASLDDYVLDEMRMPDGSITIREWLELRREQQRAKAARESAALTS